LREQEVTVALEVQQAVTFLDASRARLTEIESSYLQKAREARDAAVAAYRAGSSDLIDLLDAQRAYREVQRTHLRAWYDYQLGLCTLEGAVGAPSGELR
jgi:cobalt-zinc-cadmium efflux system outer membrane protein